MNFQLKEIDPIIEEIEAIEKEIETLKKRLYFLKKMVSKLPKTHEIDIEKDYPKPYDMT